MQSFEIWIPGEPQGQGRPRFTKTGHAYDPEKSRNYKAFIKFIVNDKAFKTGWEVLQGPVSVVISAYLPIPKSITKKRLKAIMEGREEPTKKPDIDNIYKGIMDAMSGIIYADDKQITSAYISKGYAKEPEDVGVKVVVSG